MGKKKHQNASHGIPEEFLERLTEIVGLSLFREVEKTFMERPTTFRINVIKTLKHENIKTILEERGFKIRQVPWYHDAFILLNKSKRELMDLDIYKNGQIYIQSLASMVPPLVLDPKPGEKVLDLTAAPGSKTSQIAAMMQLQGELIANDNNKVRFFKLKHNMEALGVTSSRGGLPTRDLSEGSDMGLHQPPLNQNNTASKDPSSQTRRDFLKLTMEHGSALCREYPLYFDKILLDAPCSAEARFIEGQPKTYGYWKERKIKEMAYKQRQLLLAAWSALKPGGTLVYSTCTFAPEENEAQIHLLLDRYGGEVDVQPIVVPGLKVIHPIHPHTYNIGVGVKSWKAKIYHPDVCKSVRILPTAEIEGFFVASIKKIT